MTTASLRNCLRLRVIDCESVDWLRQIIIPTPLLLLADDTIEIVLGYCFLGDMSALAATCSTLRLIVNHAIRSHGLEFHIIRTIGEPIRESDLQVQKYGLTGNQLHEPRHAIRLGSAILVAQHFSSQKGGRQCLRLLEHVPATLRACSPQATCSAVALRSCGTDFDNNVHLVPPPRLLKADSPVALGFSGPTASGIPATAAPTASCGFSAAGLDTGFGVAGVGGSDGVDCEQLCKRVFVAEDDASEPVEMRDATSGEVRRL